VLVLAALTPAMLLGPPLMVAIAATGVLAGIAVADAARSRGRPPVATGRTIVTVAGAKLPTHVELAALYSVAVSTAQRAIALLQDRGVVYGEPGRELVRRRADGAAPHG
jgi:hypothetical protein